jgi:DNA helicase IV
LELDLVLLAMLRGEDELLGAQRIAGNSDSPPWAALQPMLSLYRNQIVVDEATDFSPLQLACMVTLCHPRIRSFLACGDFNQRLTRWGTRSFDQLKWVLPDAELREITVSYRQTRQLNELAKAIIRTASGGETRVFLPENVDSEGVAPVLFEGARGHQDRIDWIAGRVREVERSVGQLPSTAIFVNSEPEVMEVANALNAALANDNIRVVPCVRGQAMGQDNDVRVFDIQHIKGLEFEVVFFAAVDRLASLQPDLFDKYLYVGATRAATYFGMTCDDSLPPSIEGLRAMFVPDWKTT